MSTTQRFQIAPPVQEALTNGQPVVALESTLISHGLPEPQNLETAHASAAAVRAGGAVPATIAVLDGILTVGVDDAGLARLAQRHPDTVKLSRRNLAPALAAGLTGSTTVAATMVAAARAGIKVFATGGIGGVHRGVQDTFDISADLTELARTDIIIVCSGAKAILDLPRTVEVLETLSVPVLGYRTNELPGFWYANTGLPTTASIDDLAQLRIIMAERIALGETSGVLLCNPPPPDVALASTAVSEWIATASAQAATAGITGPALTPYLLAACAKLSAGTTVTTNIALIVANAGLAAAVAVALTG